MAKVNGIASTLSQPAGREKRWGIFNYAMLYRALSKTTAIKLRNEKREYLVRTNIWRDAIKPNADQNI
ncbi:hypothetical protein [Enterobacter sp. KBR-315C3_2022]|uniref:hypothetical protein n=1 Tax=Enterobacter sp. KBR-315C3_2022 TaxID=3242494 RepID=UPI00352737FF